MRSNAARAPRLWRADGGERECFSSSGGEHCKLRAIVTPDRRLGCLARSVLTSAYMPKPSASRTRLDSLLRGYASTTLLTADEEARLVRAAHAGDKKALDRLVAAHMRFVFCIADQFMRYGVAFDELVSEGVLGFMEAVHRFDASRGVRLASYAALWIRALLRRYTLHNRRIVRPPSTRAARKVIGNLSRVRRELTQQLGEEPDDTLLARTLGVSVSDVQEVDGVMRKRDVLCDGQDVAGATELASVLPSPEAVAADREIAARRSVAIAHALAQLNPREQHIVAQRSLGDTPRKLEDIGSELGVSRERVRQIQNEAFAKMKVELAAVA